VPIHNTDIADAFSRIADLLDIDGANPFRVRAYRKASRTVGSLTRRAADLVAEETDLTTLPGIGRDLAAKIEEFVRTGRIAKLTELERRLPPELHQILKLTGLGPKKVKALYRRLGIDSLESLKRAAEGGKIRQLEGFGPKTEANILTEIDAVARAVQRTQWITAEAVVAAIVAHLKAGGGIAEITPAGSFRRRCETVGDLDILVAADTPGPVMERFVAYEDVERVVSRGDTRASVVLRSGLQADLRVVPADSYGAALHYFTGSQAHNIAVRRLANRAGLKINEYGVFDGHRRVAGKTEGEVFDRIGLAWIAPELREDRGEIEAAADGRLPELVTLDAIRGDLHCHTDDSDGRNSLAEMARAAAEKGYAYLAVTNHSQSLRIAGGLAPAEVLRLMATIDRLNSRMDNLVVLKSMEVDIRRDGTLDLPDRVLEHLDFTICSIHSDFRLSREKQTERILRAMDNPYFNILGHPSGRLINQRPAYAVDLQRVIAAAAQRGCCLELNAHPDRLDLDDRHCRLAKAAGVKVALATDAHHTDQFDYMRLGVAQARRGWLAADDVLNTRHLDDLLNLLKRR
jgi:DNA polymerase (family 10)